MQFGELLEIVEDEPVFEPGMLTAGREAEPGLPAQLSRWCASGRLFRLRRGLYALAPPYRKRMPHPFLVANRLVPGSYVSGLAGLAHCGAIPEFTPEVTSVGPGRPRILESPLGRFSFRFLKPALRFGYRSVALGGDQRAFIAVPEKAFLDLVHFTPGSDDPGWIEGMRFEPSGFRKSALDAFARRSGKPKWMRAARRIGEAAP